MTRIFFPVFRVVRGYIVERRRLAAVMASRSVLAGDFCDGMSTLPINGAAPNRRLRLGYVPWSLSGFLSQVSAVGELGRSA